MLMQMAGASFFFIAEYCFIVYMYHIFNIHSPMDRNLACFHVLAVVTNAAMYIEMHVSFQSSDKHTYFKWGLNAC